MKTLLTLTACCCMALAPCQAHSIENTQDGSRSVKNPFRGFEVVTEESKDLRRVSLPSAGTKKTKRPYSRMALNSHALGVAVYDPDYFSWCSSPIEVDGKIHLIISRWPNKDGMSGWTKTSEAARYVADHPEGPFTFAGTMLDNEDIKATGYVAVHNPRVTAVDGKFVMVYVARKPGNVKSQAIGMAIADTIDGKWRIVGQDGMVVHASEDPKHWTYKPKTGISNPGFLKIGDKYHIYFKYKGAKDTGFAVATSAKLEGPYEIIQKATENTSYIEDAQAFEYNNEYYLLTDDNGGKHTGIYGAQLLWKSKDGLNFKLEDTVITTGTVFDYWDGDGEKRAAVMEKEPFCRSKTGKFERPSFLLQNGVPTYYYAVAGVNIHGHKQPQIHVMKIED